MLASLACLLVQCGGRARFDASILDGGPTLVDQEGASSIEAGRGTASPGSTNRDAGDEGATSTVDAAGDDGAFADAADGHALVDVAAVSVGTTSACSVLSGGSVQCWGDNALGELGTGTTNSSSTPAAVAGLTGVTAISVGTETACAVLSGGTVECWGYNGVGKLGNGATTGPDSCCVVVDPAVPNAPCVNHPCSMVPVPVTGLAHGMAISVGSNFACALLSGGTVQCWGDNQFGELGNGTFTGPQTCCVLESPDGAGCGTFESCSSTPVAVAGLTGVTAIFVGDGTACAVLSGGAVKCWGNNTDGTLGNGMSTGPDTSSAGAPCSPTPVDVTGLTGATAVSIGVDFACALLSGGTVQCWGLNLYGELGNGSTAGPDSCSVNPCSTTAMAVPGLTGATDISASGNAACAVLQGGTVRCWGDNVYGELGNGTTIGPDTCAGAPCSTMPVVVQQ
jgi:alpha-tubulin suppressor-like RCC1 family protein